MRIHGHPQSPHRHRAQNHRSRSYEVRRALYLGVMLACVSFPVRAAAADVTAGSTGPSAARPEFSFVVGDHRITRRDLKTVAESPEVWRGTTPDGSLTAELRSLHTRLPHVEYVRWLLDVSNTGEHEVPLTGIVMLDAPAPAGARQVGDFPGSPIVAGTTFLGLEHPLAENGTTERRIRCALRFFHPLRPGEKARTSLVTGTVSSASQLRRGFLEYVEHERARPYSPFLHHNTWYNLAWIDNVYSEADALRLIDQVGRKLVVERHAKLDCFVQDDGWDDTHSLWRFHSGWPNGLAAVVPAGLRYGASAGIWLSPWGGYLETKKQRLAAVKDQEFEIKNGSFTLTGPKYYARFRDLCVDVERKSVTFFKFDGIGAHKYGEVDPSALEDCDALLRLVSELRQLKPGLYVSQTTGTWPSPWFLFHVDNIWRGARDHDFAGVGTKRQQWMTYRDGYTYNNVVRRAPLYPINSLMYHGIIFATKARGLGDDPGNDFAADVREYFGNGTQLQELYLSPELLSDSNWDDLAAAAKWARANAAVLRDTHWIGGDPLKLEVYGWAAWSPEKGIVTLRNPSDHEASFDLDLASAFELPEGATRTYGLRSVYAAPPAALAGTPTTSRLHLVLRPFEVCVLEGTPVSSR